MPDESPSQKNGIKVVVFMNRKGGVAKTTDAVFVAQGFARSGKKVLFVDFDTQQHGSIALLDMEQDQVHSQTFLPPIHPEFDPAEVDEWDGRSSSVDMFQGRETIPYPAKNFDNIDVIPSVAALRDIEQVSRNEVKARIYDRVKEFFTLPELADMYDVAIIDTPPTENIINRALLRVCTDAVIPFVPEKKPVDGVYSFFKLMGEESRYRRTAINIAGIVANKYKRCSLHDAYMTQLSEDKNLGKYMMPFPIVDRVAIPELDIYGANPATIWDLPPSNSSRKEIEAMFKFLEANIYGR